MILYAIYRNNKGDRGGKTKEASITKGVVDGDSIELGFPYKAPPQQQKQEQANVKDKQAHIIKPIDDSV